MANAKTIANIRYIFQDRRYPMSSEPIKETNKMVVLSINIIYLHFIFLMSFTTFLKK